MNRIYTQLAKGEQWIRRHRKKRPTLACVLGFTETALIPGISAAGATPRDRRITALADAEFLYYGIRPAAKYPLPPLAAGVSPVVISRALLSAQQIPIQIFDAGLPQPPTVPHIDLGGAPAACVSSGQAMPRRQVEALLSEGLRWGDRLGAASDSDYVILGECVVGGTTTALSLLLGLGIPAKGKIGSSHVNCNHQQKLAIATQGLERLAQQQGHSSAKDPLDVVAAVGDPMQIAVAAMALAASRRGGVLLAGGTQMLAVYALAKALATFYHIPWQPDNIVVGTTRWVAEDRTCDAVGLSNLIGDTALIATHLSFAESRYSALRQYELGYVKEGVAAGGCAIAANLYQDWQQPQMLAAIESLLEDLST